MIGAWRLIMDERPVVRNEIEARHGVTGHNVRYVVIISCLLVVALFIAVAVLMPR